MESSKYFGAFGIGACGYDRMTSTFSGRVSRPASRSRIILHPTKVLGGFLRMNFITTSPLSTGDLTYINIEINDVCINFR